MHHVMNYICVQEYFWIATLKIIKRYEQALLKIKNHYKYLVCGNIKVEPEEGVLDYAQRIIEQNVHGRIEVSEGKGESDQLEV